MKKLTNFYDTKDLKKNIKSSQKENISYSDVQDFYKYESFTMDNVDKKIVVPLIKYNNKLQLENDTLQVELSKVKNARDYYFELEKKFIELQKEIKEKDKTFDMNKIEIDACYNVIKELSEKNEKMEKILKEKLKMSLDDIEKYK